MSKENSCKKLYDHTKFLLRMRTIAEFKKIKRFHWEKDVRIRDALENLFIWD